MTGGYLDFHAEKRRWGPRCPEPQGGAAQPKRRCSLLGRGSLGLGHMAAQPGPLGLVFYELRPAKGTSTDRFLCPTRNMLLSQFVLCNYSSKTMTLS